MRTFAAAGLALLALLTAPGALAQQAADTIVTRGKILTVDAAFRTVEALAITNGRIVATGTSAEIARYAGKNTQIIDVAGATVIPGLIDNHFHFTRGVETWHEQARFEGVDSRREALRILAAKAASLKPGDWIMVQGGWTPRQFADAPGGFTLEELDGAAPKNPLFVQEGYSVVYANSLALKAVGLNPADGARRNAQGLVSFQPPMALYDAMPRTSAAQREQNLTDFMRELNSTGLTGVYSLGQSDFLAARAAKGPLPVRLWQTLNFNAADPASASKAAELIARTRPNQFDGQHGIFGLGEVLYGPFFDLAPRKDPWPAAIMSEYGKLATAAARAGWHVHQHVINNNAVTDLLDTLEQVNKTQPLTGLRWTLGHVYDISPANIARAKALGITLGVHGAAMQAGARMPLRQIADSGIVFGLGTDATIVSHYSPFVTLGWVVSGLDVGGNKVLDQTLTREEALIAHTRSNAYLFFQEKTLGSLEVGKQADLVVLDRDYMTVPAAEIRRIKPTMTMVGGRVVFEGRAALAISVGAWTQPVSHSWTDSKEQVCGQQRQVHAGLQQRRASRNHGQHRDDTGQRQQHDVDGIEAKVQRNPQPDRCHGDRRDGQADTRHRGSEGEIQADLHPVTLGRAHRSKRLGQQDQHRDDDPDHRHGQSSRGHGAFDCRRDQLGITDDGDQRDQEQRETHQRRARRRRGRMLRCAGRRFLRSHGQEVVPMPASLQRHEQAVETEDAIAANVSCGAENCGPGVAVVKFGTTSPRVANVARVARAAPAPSALNDTTEPRRVPTRMDKPTIPLQVMMTAANTVSRARVSAAPAPLIISVTISATSITVTATASTSEP